VAKRPGKHRKDTWFVKEKAATQFIYYSTIYFMMIGIPGIGGVSCRIKGQGEGGGGEDGGRGTHVDVHCKK